MHLLRPILYLLLIAQSTFAQSPFETKVEVKQISALLAKNAVVEALPDKVAVFLVEPVPGPQLGLSVHVQSNAKHVAVRATRVGSSKSESGIKVSSGAYLLFGVPGTYAITVIESDPELGLNFTDLEGKIEQPGVPNPPTNPEPPKDPPADTPADYQALFNTAKHVAIGLNDLSTAKALAAAYRKSLETIGNSTDLAAAKQTVVSHRRTALLLRIGDSRDINWTDFLIAIDVPVNKLGTDVPRYKLAIETVAKALESLTQGN